MRVKTNRFHLYPVYSKRSNAYLINDFEVDCTSDYDNNSAYFNTTPTVTNETILELFKQDKLKLYFHLECSATKHRETKAISYLTDDIVEIELSSLNKKTEVSFWIVATMDLNFVEFQGLNDFYSDISYDIPAFSYVGFSDTYEFYFNKRMNDDASTSSLFRISKTDKGYMYYDTTDTGIIIRLPKSAYDRYQDMKGYAIEEKISIIITPVLLSILNDIKDETLDKNRYFWMTIIEKKLIDLGYEEGFNDVLFLSKDSLTISQEIFKDIIPEALKNLEGAYQNGCDE